MLHFKDASYLQCDWLVELFWNCVPLLSHSAAIGAEQDQIGIKRYLPHLGTWRKETDVRRMMSS